MSAPPPAPITTLNTAAGPAPILAPKPQDQVLDPVRKVAQGPMPKDKTFGSTRVMITVNKNMTGAETTTTAFFRIEMPLDPTSTDDPERAMAVKSIQDITERVFEDDGFEAADLLAFLEKLLIFQEDGVMVEADDTDCEEEEQSGTDTDASDDSWARKIWIG
ncbi:uncharacterized protein Z520_11736 [Fonsecaea multimorphosa CBS 102226]|uniref:Uncharacterized protein n=1 Tax=Fonsecaea multimorphosa CBS 102226 TaxID=1442371 RepID=A0A0D2GSV8_9EURO|nr:uncharacterized protein Z520_11736 [Fonsecaea multimorphosa CBS 102226]KIX92560.1 hypothetical protein Z520_11736 [Fonsecaea multimorphosa CBS 102226]OAL17824.1 hypothetical protein AYO22_11251 [Fonsecaea multimorphosa]